jgi:hypothetical protein
MQLTAERVFAVTWIVLCVVSWGFFFFNKNGALKRKVFLPFLIGTALLFLGFAAAMGIPLHVLPFIAAALVLITFLNYRVTRFCDTCGRSTIGQNPFLPPQFCSKCGAALK